MTAHKCVFSAAYISLDTVALEDSGRVAFIPAKDQELDSVYLAPELQQFGIVTEKVHWMTQC